MKIVTIINLASLGDVLVSSALCLEVKKNFPESKLVYITTPSGLDAARGVESVDDIVIYDKRGKDKGFLNLLKFIYNFKYRGKIDYTLVLSHHYRSTILAFLLGSRIRIGYNFMHRKFLFTHVLPDKGYDPEIHFSDTFIKLLKPVAKLEPTSEMNYTVSKEADDFIEKLLKEHNCESYQLIGLSPCSNNPSKNWDVKEVAEFIKLVNADKNKKVIMTGTQAAAQMSEEIRQMGVTDFIDLTCKTNIPQFAALISKFRALVTVDTGSLHFGSILKVPTLALFFFDFYKQWGPKDLSRNSIIYTPDGISASKALEEFYRLLDKTS